MWCGGKPGPKTFMSDIKYFDSISQASKKEVSDERINLVTNGSGSKSGGVASRRFDGCSRTRPAVTHRVGWGVHDFLAGQQFHDFLAGQQFQQFPARKRQLAGVWPYQHNQYTRVLECWNVDRSCAGM